MIRRALGYLGLFASVLAAGCSTTGREPYAAVDVEMPRSRTGIVTLADTLTGATFRSLDGVAIDCSPACDYGLRLQAGSHRIGLSFNRYLAAAAALTSAETSMEVFIEPRHRYELRRLGGEDSERFGILDLGEAER